MITSILKKFSGNHYKKYFKKCQPIIAQINAHEASFQTLSDAELQAKTAEYRARFQAGESLDELLPEAFATVQKRRPPDERKELYGV